MKNFQIVLFLLSFLFVGSLVQAQSTSTIIFTHKNFLGEENLKLIISESGTNEQWVYYQGLEDSDFKKMTIQHFTRSGEDFTVKFSDAEGNKYVAKNSAKTGVLMSVNGSNEKVFGMPFTFKNGKNKFEVINAGEKTYFYFYCPALDFDDVLLFPTPTDGKNFYNELIQFFEKKQNSIYVAVVPGLNLNDEVGNLYIKSGTDSPLQIEVSYRGQVILFK
jgi:hypothetical protein